MRNNLLSFKGFISEKMENDEHIIKKYANKKNYNIGIVYHGTANDFTVFDKKKIGDNYRESEQTGFFFTQKEQSAKNYARLHTGLKSNGNLISAYLMIKNPVIVKRDTSQLGTADYFDMYHYNLMVEAEWGEGDYDAIIIEGTNNDNLYVVFESSQIKLADTRTYDNNGDIISLKKRFDKNNEDIRY